jgi:hypothetical protein
LFFSFGVYGNTDYIRRGAGQQPEGQGDFTTVPPEGMRLVKPIPRSGGTVDWPFM